MTGKRDLPKRLSVVLILLFFVVFTSITAHAEMPEHARNIVIEHIGQAVDPRSGRLVDGYAIKDYKKGHAKPDHAGGPKNNGGETSNCFSAIAKGATWTATNPYVVNFDGSGLDAAAAAIAFENAAQEWNAYTVELDVFGSQGTLSVPTGTIGLLPDGMNEMDFNLISEPGVIAVTYVWGIFSGPPPGRYLAEWDMRFNTAFTWAMDGNTSDMDFENIAQHELGHAIGLGHPDNTCTEETMYAYATAGETKKRELHDGDIAGAMDLY